MLKIVFGETEHYVLQNMSNHDLLIYVYINLPRKRKKEANTPVNPKQCPTSISEVDGDATREVRCFFCASDMFEKMSSCKGVPSVLP